MDIQNLYQQALDHLEEHDCSAHPYKTGDKLVEIIQQYNPKEILEIGTGMGYTAALMAQAAPKARIDSIEKDPEHIEVAREFLAQNKVLDQVNLINESAEDYFDKITKQYDLIFFDGYQIHYQFLPYYERLLKDGGILVCANNHLKSRTSDKFFEVLQDKTKWEILKQFADTTVAKRKQP